MGRQGEQTITIRNRISDRNWDLVAGYVAIGLGGAVLVGFTWFRTLDVVLLGWFMVLGYGAIVPFGGIVLDAAYVRNARMSWMPHWWYYIVIPLFMTGGSYFIVRHFARHASAFPIATALLGVATWLSSVLYLYRRHQYIGVL